ncbi:MAG: YbaM family protein [Gammaproteobacteria bacterium]|nr:YbaM family protein [Gammaproteobacteria bacterium]MBU2177838.1 YbaM family protein [Gammaproteobacteria bacterium]MBU2223269.1 YbaM family protein [Gammaproteobacteria bacterium]MBU2280847.1 YbaM family protein [Gammaproteobacteria bacterium]MBU2425990.1 YbaM family protein [Gammaproteobacteria bacterium]
MPDPENNNTPVPLAQAAIEVQLAVDLIMLLEQQQLPPSTILAALDIVQTDFRRAAALAATQ